MTTKFNEDSIVVSLICIFLIVTISIKIANEYNQLDLVYLFLVLVRYIYYILQKIREV